MSRGNLRAVPTPRSEGLHELRYTQIPDEILDGMGDRPYTETLVLLYVARRTFGFRRSTDAISFSQFLTGLKRHDGTRLDSGCGIKSRSTLSATIKSLEEQGLLIAERTHVGNEKATTAYRLRLRDESGEGVVRVVDYPGTPDELPVVRQMDQGVVRLPNLQHTGGQTGDIQNPPTPQRGDAPSLPTEMAQDPGVPPASPRETTPPPAPSQALEQAEARILDTPRLLDRQSKAMRKTVADNGWAEQPPARLEKIKAEVWERWRAINPERIARRDLPLIPLAVAPDEVKRFQTRTLAYLDTVGEPQFLKGFKRWLEEWRDWSAPAADGPRTMAEAMALKTVQAPPLRKEA